MLQRVISSARWLAVADLQLSLLDDTGTTRPSGTRVLLTQSQLATAFGVAPCTVSRWPLQVAERHGREAYYCLREAIEYRIGELGHLDLAQERARLARVQTERQELALQRERGELLDADDVLQVWSTYIAVAKARMLALPDVAAARVVGVSVHEAAAILRQLVHEAQTELAEYNPDDFAAGTMPASPESAGLDPAPRQGGRQDRRKRSVVDAAGAPSTGAAPPQELEAAHAAPPGAGRGDLPRPAIISTSETTNFGRAAAQRQLGERDQS